MVDELASTSGLIAAVIVAVAGIGQAAGGRTKA
jgi:hypothetical protein